MRPPPLPAAQQAARCSLGPAATAATTRTPAHHTTISHPHFSLGLHEGVREAVGGHIQGCSRRSELLAGLTGLLALVGGGGIQVDGCC